MYAQREDFFQRVGMVKHREVEIAGWVARPRDLCEVAFGRDRAEARLEVRQVRNAQARKGEDAAEWVDIIADHVSAAQCRFDERGAAPGERIVDGVAFAGEQVDEKAGKLRLEAGAVGDLMERRGLFLFCGPEFVDEPGIVLVANPNRIDACVLRGSGLEEVASEVT